MSMTAIMITNRIKVINTAAPTRCNSSHFSHVTRYLNSAQTSLKKSVSFFMVRGREDSNPQPAVLETAALPVELLPHQSLGSKQHYISQKFQNAFRQNNWSAGTGFRLKIGLPAIQ